MVKEYIVHWVAISTWCSNKILPFYLLQIKPNKEVLLILLYYLMNALNIILLSHGFERQSERFVFWSEGGWQQDMSNLRGNSIYGIYSPEYLQTIDPTSRSDSATMVIFRNLRRELCTFWLGKGNQLKATTLKKCPNKLTFKLITLLVKAESLLDWGLLLKVGTKGTPKFFLPSTREEGDLKT